MTRTGFTLITLLATAGLLYPRQAPGLVWNASASAPLGLYRIDADGRYHVGDLVAVDPPEPLASFLAERGYLARGLPLIKRIRAVAGQFVCRRQLTITVNGIEVGAARRRDGAGRNLPDWQGCRHLASNQLFLMNWQVRDSLDGRYFGPTLTAQILGRAVPLWTDADANGRFEWRAPAWRKRPAAVIAPHATSSPSMDRRPT
ncbi:peptidase S26 [Mesorhizobium loti]|nr:S26 family signal peptidase [Mesorhizobium loti]PLP61368.1 peptidase S26 [Mesorhizobium loti]